MFKKFLIAVVALFVLIFVVGLALPGHWEIQTSTTINAPPAKIYADIAALNTWFEWTAWNRDKDPECENTYHGPRTGVGSTWKWVGDPNGLGKGSMVITKADPATGIEYDINLEGFPTCKGSIELKTVEHGTEVVWQSSGTSGGGMFVELMMKYMTAFGTMESTMLAEYDFGLKNLKYRAESGTPSTGTAVDASAKKK